MNNLRKNLCARFSLRSFAFGLLIGLGVGLATKNTAVGIAVGVAFATTFGTFGCRSLRKKTL